MYLIQDINMHDSQFFNHGLNYELITSLSRTTHTGNNNHCDIMYLCISDIRVSEKDKPAILCQFCVDN